MNENFLVVLLVVIIFALIASIVTAIVILFMLNERFNDADHQYISTRNRLDVIIRSLGDIDYQYTSTRNRLDAIIGSLDDLCNVCENISEDTHSVDAEEVEKCKDLKEEKKVDGECADCMFRSKSYHEEPCFHCSHAYLSQFTSSRNKE